jgi:uncharacterized protein (DUF362 family)
MPKSKVVLVRSRSLGSGGSADLSKLGNMLSRAVSLLHGGADSGDVWRQIVLNTGRIALKPNCVAGRNMSTSVQLTMALVQNLTHAGKEENDIVIWDMTNSKLKAAGYQLNMGRKGLKCYGTDSRDVGYGHSFHVKGKVASLVTKIVESHCDHSINLPILKDHSLAGVSGAMKNYYGVVHNPNKYHDNNCDPYVAEISALPVVKDKDVLTVMDLTWIQYHGGPGYRGEYAVRYGGIMMSPDPVAIDAIGEKIIDDYRTGNEMKTLAESGRPPKWLGTAQALGLGNADLAAIDLVEISVD